MKDLDKELREIMERASKMVGTDEPFSKENTSLLDGLKQIPSSWIDPRDLVRERGYIVYRITQDLTVKMLFEIFKEMEGQGVDIHVQQGCLPKCFTVSPNIDEEEFIEKYKELVYMYELKEEGGVIYGLNENKSIMSYIDNDGPFFYSCESDDDLDFDFDDKIEVDILTKPLHEFDISKFNDVITNNDVNIMAKDFIEDDEYSINKIIDLNRLLAADLEYMTNALKNKNMNRSYYVEKHVKRISNIERAALDIIEHKSMLSSKAIDDRVNKLVSNLKPDQVEYRKEILAHMTSCKRVVRDFIIELIQELASDFFNLVRCQYDNISLSVNVMRGE